MEGRRRLTADLVARVEREIPDPGPDPSRTEMDDATRSAAARALLAEKGEGPFWLFAYGSLIWKPAFDHEEERAVTAHGWRRSFCLDMRRWRATEDQPGLMMALVRGGSCRGVAYRLPDGDDEAQMIRLLEREVPYTEFLPWTRWLTLRDGAERIRALTFYAMTPSAENFITLPIAEQATRIARAAGHAGSNAAYLHNTVVHLDERGIRDSYLHLLEDLVAEEIRGLG